MSHRVDGSLRSKELDGDNSEKDCCVTHRWWLATLEGTRRGLPRKGLLCRTALVTCYARRNLTGITAKRTAVSHRVGGSLRSKELDGDYSEKDCCFTKSW